MLLLCGWNSEQESEENLPGPITELGEGKVRTEGLIKESVWCLVGIVLELCPIGDTYAFISTLKQ